VTHRSMRLMLRVAICIVLIAVTELFAGGPIGASTIQPNWSILAAPNLEAAGLSVSCPTATLCMVVGYEGESTNRSLALVMNGQKWSVTAQPSYGMPGSSEVLASVSCASAEACVAVGEFEGGSLGQTGSGALIEMWNGRSWVVAATPPLPLGDSELNSVSCVSASDCVAVGMKGDLSTAGYRGQPLVEIWNGRAWSIGNNPNPSGWYAQLSSVSCPSAGTCIGVGAQSGTQNGRSVTRPVAELISGSISAPITGLDSSLPVVFQGVSCANENDCTIVGYKWDATRGIVNGGLVESWNGTKGTRIPSPTGEQLDSVSCPSPRSCVATGAANGSSGGNLISTSNGKVWALVKGPYLEHSALDGIFCSRTRCIAVGSVTRGNSIRLLVERNT
jgi:hypothetical protein